MLTKGIPAQMVKNSDFVSFALGLIDQISSFLVQKHNLRWYFIDSTSSGIDKQYGTNSISAVLLFEMAVPGVSSKDSGNLKRKYANLVLENNKNKQISFVFPFEMEFPGVSSKAVSNLKENTGSSTEVSRRIGAVKL